MKATLLILIFLFHFSNNIFAANFKSGYIIQLNNDTLKGYIKKQKEERLSKCIFFKSQPGKSEIIKYDPTQIKSFGFYSSSRTYFPVEYIYRSDSIQLHDVRFGRLLYSGSVKLYKIGLPMEEQNYKYESPTYYAYVIEKNNSYYTLSRREEAAKLEKEGFAHFRGKELGLNLTVSRIRKDYIRILHFVLSDRPEIGFMIDRLDFTDNSFIKLLKKYEDQTK